jgi:hypothetical protein
MGTSEHALDTVRQGGELLLRLVRRSDATSRLPAVLEVIPAASQPAPDKLRRLDAEYALRTKLDPAWPARPLELPRCEGRPVLVLEDPASKPLRASWASA